MPALERPSALLLDLDGTLVDSEPLHRTAYAAFFARRGWSGIDLATFTGRRAEDVFVTDPGPWTGLDPIALAAEVVALMPDTAPAPLPGTVDLLRATAAAGIPLAVVTSARPPWVRRSLAPLGVLGLIDAVVTAEDVMDGKPDPAGFALACRRLGVSPAHALAVEDSPAGVVAARAAGVEEVVGVTTSEAAATLVAAGARTTYADLRPLVDLVVGGRP